MPAEHDIRTYYDGYKHVRYCVKCGEDSEIVLYGEPCSEKLISKTVDKKETKA